MPPSNAISALGTLLQIGNTATSPTSYTSVAEIKDVAPANLKLKTKEVTTQVSPGGFSEYIGTTIDGGKVTFTVNYLPTDPTHNNSAGLRYIMRTRKPWSFKIVYSDSGASADTFQALIEDIKPDAKVADELTEQITLQITGQPTLV
jgi:hypothetical protein